MSHLHFGAVFFVGICSPIIQRKSISRLFIVSGKKGLGLAIYTPSSQPKKKKKNVKNDKMCSIFAKTILLRHKLYHVFCFSM